MERFERLIRLKPERDKGRISVTVVGLVTFIGVYALSLIDKGSSDSEPRPAATTVESTLPAGDLSGRITPSTLSPEDQAILDAIESHHASTSTDATIEVISESSVPVTSHEAHDSSSSVESTVATDTTHAHNPASEQSQMPPEAPPTVTTIAHSTHTEPAPVTQTPPATPSPETTHAHTPIASPETQPSITTGPVTINSTAPPQAPVPVPAG